MLRKAPQRYIWSDCISPVELKFHPHEDMTVLRESPWYEEILKE